MWTLVSCYAPDIFRAYSMDSEKQMLPSVHGHEISIESRTQLSLCNYLKIDAFA